MAGGERAEARDTEDPKDPAVQSARARAPGALLRAAGPSGGAFTGVPGVHPRRHLRTEPGGSGTGREGAPTVTAVPPATAAAIPSWETSSAGVAEAQAWEAAPPPGVTPRRAWPLPTVDPARHFRPELKQGRQAAPAPRGA